MDLYLKCDHHENQYFHAKMDLKKLKLQMWPEGENRPPSRKESASHHVLNHIYTPTNTFTHLATHQGGEEIFNFRCFGMFWWRLVAGRCVFKILENNDFK